LIINTRRQDDLANAVCLYTTGLVLEKTLSIATSPISLSCGVSVFRGPLRNSRRLDVTFELDETAAYRRVDAAPGSLRLTITATSNAYPSLPHDRHGSRF